MYQDELYKLMKATKDDKSLFAFSTYLKTKNECDPAKDNNALLRTAILINPLAANRLLTDDRVITKLKESRNCKKLQVALKTATNLFHMDLVIKIKNIVWPECKYYECPEQLKFTPNAERKVLTSQVRQFEKNRKRVLTATNDLPEDIQNVVGKLLDLKNSLSG